MYKVLITPRSFGSTSKKPFEILEKAGYEINYNDTGNKYSKEDMKRLIKDVDAVIIGTDPLDKEVISEAKNLKIISKYGVGLDNIDLEEASKSDVTVTITPDANADSVAELAFAMMMGLSRRITEADKKVKSGYEGKIVGNTVWGKKLGIIGLGRIGKELTKRANGFNMEVCYFDKNLLSVEEEKKLNVSYRNLDTIVKESDYISIHTPLLKTTENLIDLKQLKQMKKTAFLINTSREKIINEKSLINALKENQIKGVALDEFEFDPTKLPKEVIDKIILTPHMGSHTDEAIENMGVAAANNVVDILEENNIAEKNLV